MVGPGAIRQQLDRQPRRQNTAACFRKDCDLMTARGLVTVYAHNSQNLVAQGDRVLRGEPIARVGRTGNATGPGAIGGGGSRRCCAINIDGVLPVNTGRPHSISYSINPSE